jgi:hypothetical protein
MLYHKVLQIWGMHFTSFERRKSDGFGGRMSTKIKEALSKNV